MKPIIEVVAQLNTPKKIAITCHYRPDGDAIGSILGLFHYLSLKGHEVMPITPNEVPDFLSFLPGFDALVNFEALPSKATAFIEAADYIFCLDYNNLSRVHALTPVLEAATQDLILIDHHLQPSEVFAFGISDSSKSSTCEMVYDFIDAAGDAHLVNEQIGTCIYTGMLTDTGSFRFPSTSARVHEIIMHLKNKGLQHHLVHEAVYDNWTLNRLQFMGFVLSQKMEIFPSIHSGIIALSSEEKAQGAPLFSTVLNIAFQDSGDTDCSRIRFLRNSRMMSKGFISTGQASTQALQLVQACNSSLLI